MNWASVKIVEPPGLWVTLLKKSFETTRKVIVAHDVMLALLDDLELLARSSVMQSCPAKYVSLLPVFP
jgi:hypothetical protein